jgi:hypothetical protein
MGSSSLIGTGSPKAIDAFQSVVGGHLKDSSNTTLALEFFNDWKAASLFAFGETSPSIGRMFSFGEVGGSFGENDSGTVSLGEDLLGDLKKNLSRNVLFISTPPAFSLDKALNPCSELSIEAENGDLSPAPLLG